MDDIEFYSALRGGARDDMFRKMCDEVARRYVHAVAPRLTAIHRQLVLDESEKLRELDEQILAVQYIRPDANVLELGSNIGRNTLVIASILKCPGRQLVTVECDPVAYREMRLNLRVNMLRARTVCAAVSERPLFRKGYDTRIDRPDASWDPVPTVSFDELQNSCRIVFDTLVADCEGALEQILRDRPGMLADMSTLILENDYHTVEAYRFVNGVIRRAGFKRVASVACSNTSLPIATRFYAVWTKAHAKKHERIRKQDEQQ